MRGGIQLAAELLRLPGEPLVVNPNPHLESRVVELQGILDLAGRELEISNDSYDQMQADRDRLGAELLQSQRNLANALDLAAHPPDHRTAATAALPGTRDPAARREPCASERLQSIPTPPFSPDVPGLRSYFTDNGEFSEGDEGG